MSELILRTVPWLFGIDAALLAAHLAWGSERYWNLDKEHNLPTFFSGVQLVLLGFVALDALGRERALAVRYFPSSRAWAVLGVAFFYLAVDETTVLHEGLFRNEVRDLLPPDSLWISLLPWQIVFAPALAALALLLLALFFTRFARNGEILTPALAGLGCWVGAVVTEGLAKPLFMVRGWYRAEVAIEEGLELAGATLLLVAFSRYGGALARGPLPRIDVRGQMRRFAFATLALVVVAAAGASAVAALSLRNSAWLYHHNAALLQKRGKHAEALAAYRQALERKPGDPQTLRGLALASYRLERYEEALGWYDRALEADAGDPALWNYRGTVLYKLADYDAAEGSYREALRRDGRDAKAHANLGLALEKQGRLAEALEAFERSRELDPSHSTAVSGIERLRPSERAIR